MRKGWKEKNRKKCTRSWVENKKMWGTQKWFEYWDGKQTFVYSHKKRIIYKKRLRIIKKYHKFVRWRCQRKAKEKNYNYVSLYSHTSGVPLSKAEILSLCSWFLSEPVCKDWFSITISFILKVSMFTCTNSAAFFRAQKSQATSNASTVQSFLRFFLSSLYFPFAMSTGVYN